MWNSLVSSDIIDGVGVKYKFEIVGDRKSKSYFLLINIVFIHSFKFETFYFYFNL